MSGHKTPWLTDVVLIIAAFKGLRRGWDSYGAHPISKKTRAFAIVTITAIAEGVSGLSKPHVTPTCNGGVNFEWDDPASEETYINLDAGPGTDGDRTVDADVSICGRVVSMRDGVAWFGPMAALAGITEESR